MREREPERPRADGGRLQAGGRRSPEAGRTAGPAPPGRQRRTGYYQRMNREDGSATAPMIRAGRSRQTGPPAWRPRRNRDGCASPPATR